MGNSTLSTMSTVGEEMQRAIDALTNLARHDDIEAGRFDAADLIARVTTCVAANLGSVETFLASARPGGHVERVTGLIDAIVPRERLLTQRTRDVHLRLDVAATFRVTGITGKFEADAHAVRAALQRVTDPITAHELGEQLSAMHSLYEADKAALLSAYATAATDYLRGAGLPAHIPVVVAAEPAAADAVPVWDDLSAEAHAAASAATAGFLEHLVQGAGYRTQAQRLLTGTGTAEVA